MIYQKDTVRQCILTLRIWCLVVAAASTSVVSLQAIATVADDLNKEIRTKTLDAKALLAGETLYQKICVSCHGKKLEGGVGLNLVDGQWVHGSAPFAIYNNISNGFMNAGMPAYKDIFSQQQIKQIVAYVLSKREGWDKLRYTVYSIAEDSAPDFAQLGAAKPIKTGHLTTNLANFAVPEMEHYAIRFEGEFYSPWKKPVNLWFDTPDSVQIQVEIDGNIVKRNPSVSEPTFSLKPGKQQLRITYITAGTPQWVNKDLTAVVASDDLLIKYSPVSSAGKRFLERNTYKVIADKRAQVIRRKIIGLPSSSIAVGLTGKINYAFNSKSCAIVGVWKGDLLNIGPNIDGRGRDPSLPLGDWVFHYPEVITIAQHETQSSSERCQLSRYARLGHPVIYFAKEGAHYSVSGHAINNGIRFDYNVVLPDEQTTPLIVSVPTSSRYNVSSNRGSINNGQLILAPANRHVFSIQLTDI